MSILVDKDSRVICQGITGNQGSFHAEQCMEYGTQVVAGVTPGRGGEEHLGVHVYDTMGEAVVADGRRRQHDLRAGPIRRRCHTRGRRRRYQADRLYHRRHTRLGHGAR